MKKILFIYNPVSGKGAMKSKLSYIIETISKEGIVTTIPTSKRGDGTKGYMNVDKKYRKPCA